jgi:hypothetical protein
MRAGSRLHYPVSVVRSVFDQSGPANRQLTKALGLVLLLVIVISLPSLLAWMPGTDLEIPLRAASRWADGGTPYVASSFAETSGTGLPFLYPPFVLPALSAIVGLPRPLVLGAWLVLLLAVAIWTCRRLSVPWPAVPVVLLWPPFMEGLVAGNVQVLQLAAFVALFFVPGRAWELRPRSWTRSGSSDGGGRLGNDTRYGLYAAGIGAVKSTQLLALVWLLRLRPRAAIIGGAALAAVALAMLPLTGLQLYRDWMDQLGRAADLSWAPAGAPLDFMIGRPLALVAAGLAFGAMFFVRGRDAGAWVGIAMIVAAPSVHGYGMLLLLPTLLVLRRDIAITLAIMIARYNPYSWWISIAIVAVCLAASKVYPALRVQVEADREEAGQALVPADPAKSLRRPSR